MFNPFTVPRVTAAASVLTVAVLVLPVAEARQLPIVRQTEAQMEQAFLQVLSGKKVRRQGKDDSYPEQKEELGKKFSHYLKPQAVAEVFIPFEARGIRDEDVQRIFAEAVIVDYEKLEPLALKPCDLIRITDKKDYSYDLCIFAAPDLRGTVTFPNYQRFWFAVPGQDRLMP